MVITEMEPDVLWAETGRWKAIEADLTLGFAPRRGRLQRGGGLRRTRSGAAATRRLGRDRGRAVRRTQRPAQGRPHPGREDALMARIIGLVLSALMVVVGVIWTLQGLDVIKGSSMSGQDYWAVVGPAIAGFGLALGIVVPPRPALTSGSDSQALPASGQVPHTAGPAAAADLWSDARARRGCPEQWRFA